MNCPQCGNAVSGSDRACQNCGAPLRSTQRRTVSQDTGTRSHAASGGEPTRRRAVSQEIKPSASQARTTADGSVRRRSVSQNAGNGRRTTTSPASRKRKSRKRLPWVIIIVVIIALVAVGITQCSSCDTNGIGASNETSTVPTSDQSVNGDIETWTIDQVTAEDAKRCLLVKDGDKFTPLLSTIFFNKSYESRINMSNWNEEQMGAMAEFLSAYCPDAMQSTKEEILAEWKEDLEEARNYGYADDLVEEPDAETLNREVIRRVIEGKIGDRIFYSINGRIPVIDREKGQQLVSNVSMNCTLRQLAEKPLYVWDYLAYPSSNLWKTPIVINGNDCSSMGEAITALRNANAYTLGQSVCVSVEPTEFTLGTWSGTNFSEADVKVNIMGWPEGKDNISMNSKNDDFFEVTKEGYFVVKIDDLPAGFYNVTTGGGYGTNCLIEIR